MKYLKKWKLFENHDEIHSICEKYGIENYTINSDGSIDVDGDVELDVDDVVLTKLPLMFNHISGHFYCSNNQLTNLEGAPKKVGGVFTCNDNQLTSLEGAPKEVGDSFYCNNNQLTSLEGCPKKVGGVFSCSDNQLTSLEGGPKEVCGSFYCYNNKLTSLEGAPKKVGGVFTCHDNQLTGLEGAPKEVGDFYCRNNKLKNLDHLPNVSRKIYMEGNPVYSIVQDWIFYTNQTCITTGKNECRWEKWEYFQDLNIIQGDKVILERLEEFHEVMEIPMPDLKEIKKYYTIVE